jgi:hypothetical protein
VGGIGVVSGDRYDREHEQVRRALLSSYHPDTPCPRCDQPLGIDPSALDLGHRDDGAGWNGLEHARCNRGAGGRLGHARRKARRARAANQVEEAAIGIEVSEDRRHTSVVTAGRLPGEHVLLRLAHYLTGTDPVAAVLELHDDLVVVVATVVDPRSFGATVIRPLEAAGLDVTRPSSGDLAEAHGLFLDSLDAGRVRHQRQQELTAAMRHLDQRRLGGASGPERRGSPVDIGPAVAAELATWGILVSPKPYDPADSVR